MKCVKYFLIFSGWLKASLCNIIIPISGFSDTTRNSGSAKTFSMGRVNIWRWFYFYFFPFPLWCYPVTHFGITGANLGSANVEDSVHLTALEFVQLNEESWSFYCPYISPTPEGKDVDVIWKVWRVKKLKGSNGFNCYLRSKAKAQIPAPPAFLLFAVWCRHLEQLCWYAACASSISLFPPWKSGPDVGHLSRCYKPRKKWLSIVRRRVQISWNLGQAVPDGLKVSMAGG